MLVGSILALDLRLLGLGRAIPIQPMAQLLLPVSRLGFLLAISMGFLLFSADAAHVVRNPAFQTKLLLIAAALVNILIAHAGPWRRLALWRAEASGGAKVTALVSLLLWLSAVCAGRLIAYFWRGRPPCAASASPSSHSSSASARKRCLDECALLREERFLA